jgi:hypothetical protein
MMVRFRDGQYWGFAPDGSSAVLGAHLVDAAAWAREGASDGPPPGIVPAPHHGGAPEEPEGPEAT